MGKEIEKMSIENFNKSFDVTMGHEGGYSNDPQDPGGETYKGIARNYHPNWKGWEIIDKNIKNLSIVTDDLDILVRNFYLTEFWFKCNCDNLHPYIASELFDSAVNCGIIPSCKWLQESINFLNNNQKHYPDIRVDGSIGSGTISALKQFINIYGIDYYKIIIKIMNILQGNHYLELMRKYPVKEKYIGWFKRVSL